MLDAGLAQQVGARLRVLILGSFPGVRSLKDGQYYAHPQNRFWPSVAPVCGIAADAPYPARIRALHARGIGLWDVLAACARPGSMDQAIVRGSEVPNDLGALVGAHGELRAILLNGGSAAGLFHLHQVPRSLWSDMGIEIRVLPSTSPAHARMRPAEVAQAWRDAIRPHL